jgi:hypothetical protein
MKYAIKRRIIYTMLACVVAVAISNVSHAQAPPTVELPEQCSRIGVPAGNTLAYRVYATGVQVYWWNGTSWGFVGPIASLYADANYQGKVGTHYGGPTWKSNSGGLVIGKKRDECSPDPNSIAWLLLYADEVDGAGMFSDTTFIQRLNTQGGKAPGYPGTYDGERAEVPYTTEYYFYRSAGGHSELPE